MSKKIIKTVMLDGEKYQVEITPDIEDGGFVAEVVELPGCITQGETLEETLEMVKDAIKTYLKPIID